MSEPAKMGFTVQLASDSDYDKLVAEINFGDQFVCLLSQDEGLDRLTIDFPKAWPAAGKAAMHRLPLGEFLAAVEKARRRLVG